MSLICHDIFSGHNRCLHFSQDIGPICSNALCRGISRHIACVMSLWGFERSVFCVYFQLRLLDHISTNLGTSWENLWWHWQCCRVPYSIEYLLDTENALTITPSTMGHYGWNFTTPKEPLSCLRERYIPQSPAAAGPHQKWVWWIKSPCCLHYTITPLSVLDHTPQRPPSVMGQMDMDGRKIA